MTDTDQTLQTWHGLSEANELRLLRCQAIADRLDELAKERDALYRERAEIIGDARLDPDGPPAPAQLLALYSRVTDGAIQHQFREEETRRGLDRNALGRGLAKRGG